MNAIFFNMGCNLFISLITKKVYTCTYQIIFPYSWSKHFSDAIESFNRREGKSKLKEPFNDDDSDSERLHDLPPANEVAPERAEAVGGEEQSQQKASTATVSSSSTAKENRTSVAESDSSTATKEDQETQQQEEDDQEGRNKSDVTSDSRDSSAESPSK